MAVDVKTNSKIRVTINRTVRREAARKTLERLFMSDPEVSGPIKARSKNFKTVTKRWGGTHWTNHPSKIHLSLQPGDSATLVATSQYIRDLGSVSDIVVIESV